MSRVFANGPADINVTYKQFACKYIYIYIYIQANSL